MKNDGIGTTGIIFDHSSGDIRDPWSRFYHYSLANAPQHTHLFDFGREGRYQNAWAQQRAAVFWREILDFVLEPPCRIERSVSRTIVHEDATISLCEEKMGTDT